MNLIDSRFVQICTLQFGAHILYTHRTNIKPHNLLWKKNQRSQSANQQWQKKVCKACFFSHKIIIACFRQPLLFFSFHFIFLFFAFYSVPSFSYAFCEHTLDHFYWKFMSIHWKDKMKQLRMCFNNQILKQTIQQQQQKIAHKKN